jgi:hypothetical protein
LESVEKELYLGKVTEQEVITLEYLSKTILSGARPYELEILKYLLDNDVINLDQIKQEFRMSYGYEIEMSSFENAIEVLQGKFVSKEDELKKYSHIDIIYYDEDLKVLQIV